MLEYLTGLLHRYSDLLSGASVLLTAVYAILTYLILRANQKTVASMQSEALQERRFRMKEHFLSGVAAIAEYDRHSAGCPQAMRLLDYYSSLALAQNDPDLFHILNTLMTAAIRTNIEAIQETNQELYPYAVAARERIMPMLKNEHIERKKSIM